MSICSSRSCASRSLIDSVAYFTGSSLSYLDKNVSKLFESGISSGQCTIRTSAERSVSAVAMRQGNRNLSSICLLILPASLLETFVIRTASTFFSSRNTDMFSFISKSESVTWRRKKSATCGPIDSAITL